MNRRPRPSLALAAAVVCTAAAGAGAGAQETQGGEEARSGDTPILPDARPGDCFAKVMTPARLATRAEEVVVQEASERIEVIPARYETIERRILVKEAGEEIAAGAATFREEPVTIVTRPAETLWTTRLGEREIPASPGALEGIERSGIDVAALEPGSCFREYFTPADYRDGEERVLVKEAFERIEVTAAVYETVEERVLVKEASSLIVDVPPIYATETESVLVEPARSVWRTEGCGLVERVDNTTGEVMCLVEVPARYETLTRTVLERPATTKKVRVPPEYTSVKVQRLVTPASERRLPVEAEHRGVDTRTKVADATFFWLAKGETPGVEATWNGNEACLTERAADTRTLSRQVVVEPAASEVTEIPARHRDISVERLVAPPEERRIETPARTRTVTGQVQLAPSRLEWRKVLCEASMTPGFVTSLQRALKREGYDPGAIDGVIGRATMEAIERFQSEKRLDRGGLTQQTLKALNVSS